MGAIRYWEPEDQGYGVDKYEGYAVWVNSEYRPTNEDEYPDCEDFVKKYTEDIIRHYIRIASDWFYEKVEDQREELVKTMRECGFDDYKKDFKIVNKNC